MSFGNILVFLVLGYFIFRAATPKKKSEEDVQKALDKVREEEEVMMALEAPRLGNIDDMPELPPDEVEDVYRGSS